MLNFASKGMAANKPQSSSDPFYANVSLLMHMDGVNGGTTFTDQKGNTVTPSAVVTDTATKKFGTASAQFTNSPNNDLQITNNSTFDFGTGDFTIEMWVNSAGVGSVGGALLARWGANSDFLLYINSSGKPTFISSNLGFTLNGGSLTGNTWQFVTLVRSGNTFTLYIDGIATATTTSSAAIQYTAAQPITLGSWSNDSTTFLNGHIDEVRVTKGVARYTANFTPPSGPFPNS